MTLEQICRDLLHKAIEDGLVKRTRGKFSNRGDQEFTAGELVGMANLLNERMAPKPIVFPEAKITSLKIVGRHECNDPENCDVCKTRCVIIVNPATGEMMKWETE